MRILLEHELKSRCFAALSMTTSKEAVGSESKDVAGDVS
jgi:hypothetical protein